MEPLEAGDLSTVLIDVTEPVEDVEVESGPHPRPARDMSTGRARSASVSSLSKPSSHECTACP